jgi:DMSO/TMAO reductase YedYZ molybdopterin-dependent catalytic subunit
MRDSLIAAKERWVLKMAGKHKHQVRSTDRLPPGQRLVTAFPTLDLGIQPELAMENWQLTISGNVERPVTLQWAQFMALPQFHDISDFHCVTTWSLFDMAFTGVSFFTIADLVQPTAEARHVFFKGYDGYTTNNPLEALMDDDVMIAHSWNGQPLTRDHGGPARVIVPKRYAWKGTKWVKEIVFLDHDMLGFWELRGYSNTADPFTEDRFV